MRSRVFFFAAVLCLPACTLAQDDEHLTGYVSAVGVSGAIDINGVRILLTPKTKWRTPEGETKGEVAPVPLYVGQPAAATGQLHVTHRFTATRITLAAATTVRVSGAAIIDLVPPAPAALAATDKVVRTDGYLLHLTAKTKLTLTAPLTSITDIATNQWIEYDGVQQLDGTVLVDRADIVPNTISPGEDKLLNKTDYDPDQVSGAERQSGASKLFTGTDARRLPPYGNADMLDRVQRIGNALIPAYQRALPDGDPTKIYFRFQVVDTTKWRAAVTMPSGVIVVPHQVVERMQNDDQLAAILADAIAETLEKAAFRFLPEKHRVLAVGVAGAVSAMLVPGTGMIDLAAIDARQRLIDEQVRQSGRVSLDLVNDAGYDLLQAPVAWRLLAPEIPQPIETIAMPPRAENLYQAIGTTWRGAASTAR